MKYFNDKEEENILKRRVKQKQRQNPDSSLEREERKQKKILIGDIAGRRIENKNTHTQN